MRDITETAAFQTLLVKGRKNGKVTVADLNEMSPEDISTSHIEDVMARLYEEDIRVVER